MCKVSLLNIDNDDEFANNLKFALLREEIEITRKISNICNNFAFDNWQQMPVFIKFQALIKGNLNWVFM